MLRAILLYAALCILVAGGQARSAAGEPKRMTWEVDGVTREALVYLPETPAGAPVVFVWHGHGGRMAGPARSFDIHRLWPEAIVAYPQGLPTPGRLTHPEGRLPGWQFGPGDQQDRDLKFFDAMLAAFQKDYRCDAKRVYATGHSNGGRFTYVLWAARPNAVAAVAPSASPADGLLALLKPKPCFHIAGEMDRLVPLERQKRTLEEIRRIDQCEPDGAPWRDPASKTVIRYTSRAGAPVVTLIHPGAHVVPAEAPALIVRFFKEFTAK